MDKLKRPAVLVPLAILVFVLILLAGAGGAYFALKGSDTEDEGFIARGTISATALGVDGFTPAARNCIITTRHDGLIVKEGMPITITLDGEAVGTGALPQGRYWASTEPPVLGASCSFPIAIKVSRTAPEGSEYRIDIAPKIGLSLTTEELKSGKWDFAL